MKLKLNKMKIKSLICKIKNRQNKISKINKTKKSWKNKFNRQII